MSAPIRGFDPNERYVNLEAVNAELEKKLISTTTDNIVSQIEENLSLTFNYNNGQYSMLSEYDIRLIKRDISDWIKSTLTNQKEKLKKVEEKNLSEIFASYVAGTRTLSPGGFNVCTGHGISFTGISEFAYKITTTNRSIAFGAWFGYNPTSAWGSLGNELPYAGAMLYRPSEAVVDSRNIKNVIENAFTTLLR